MLFFLMTSVKKMKKKSNSGYSYAKRLFNQETVTPHNYIKYAIWSLIHPVNLSPDEKRYDFCR